MPVAASTVSKLTYLARENTPGTLQRPNKYLHGLNLRIVGNSTRGEVRPSGSTMRTSRPLIQDWSTFTIADGSYMDYNSLIYPAAGLFGVPVTSTPGGGTITREHLFTYAADGSNVRPAFSFATGYRNGTTEQTVRNIFQSFNFGITRGAAPTIGGGGYGRNIDLDGTLVSNEVNTITSVGSSTDTFTITVNGQTTAAIDWDATNSEVQSALEALSNVAPGDVTVTGGPGGTTPFTLTWGGVLANTNITISTTPTGGTAALATVNTGGITTIPVVAIEAPEWSIALDSTAGGIGTTKVRPYSAEFNFSGLTNPDWVIDDAQDSYDDDVLQVPELTANMVLRNDATSRALYPLLLGGDTMYLQYRAVGPIIEGSLRYEFRLRMAVQASENVGQFGDEGGSETMPFPLTIVSDSNLASGGMELLIRNVLTDL